MCVGIVQAIFRKLKGKASAFVIYSYFIPFSMAFSAFITIFEENDSVMSLKEWMLVTIFGILGFVHNILSTRSF